jgi:outer membrane protein assembly factor BamE (lipoprotein component of BamABCDE complex)
MKSIIVAFALLISLPVSTLFPDGFESLRDPDVLYFEGKPGDFPLQQMEKLTPVFTDKDLRSLIQNLTASSKVRVIGWHSQGWLIQSVETPSSVEGWVSPDAIQVVSPDDLQKMREKVERGRVLKEAISEKKVIPGMGLDEVRRSLGKPQQVSFREDEKGKTETWNYIRYENVPEVRWGRDLFGNVVQSTIMIRVPKGEVKVEFKDGKVVAYEEKK